MRFILLALLVACAHEDAPDPKPAVAPVDDCQRACARYRTCVSHYTAAMHDSCVRDCRNVDGFRKRPFDATAFADCLTALSCDAIETSMAMNEGPAGRCYTGALR